MASIEGKPSRRVSVFALSRNLRNGGNNPQNRQEALRLISETGNDPSNYVYRNYLLDPDLQAGWRREGEVKDKDLDSANFATKPSKNPR